MATKSLLRKLLAATVLVAPLAVVPVQQAHAGIFISVGFAPPALPVYV